MLNREWLDRQFWTFGSTRESEQVAILRRFPNTDEFGLQALGIIVLDQNPCCSFHRGKQACSLRNCVRRERLAHRASGLGGHPKPASRGQLKTGQLQAANQDMFVLP